MGAAAFDTQSENLRAQVNESLVVLTERSQLAASYASEVEDIPQQDGRSAAQHVIERDRISSRGWQRETRRLIPNTDRRRSLIVIHASKSNVQDPAL
jgi:hypothetical protein